MKFLHMCKECILQAFPEILTDLALHQELSLGSARRFNRKPLSDINFLFQKCIPGNIEKSNPVLSYCISDDKTPVQNSFFRNLVCIDGGCISFSSTVRTEICLLIFLHTFHAFRHIFFLLLSAILADFQQNHCRIILTVSAPSACSLS